jgi:hypothetical protein
MASIALANIGFPAKAVFKFVLKTPILWVRT